MNNFYLPTEISLDKWPSLNTFIDTAKLLVDEAEKEGIVIRIMGAIAIFMHSNKYEELWHRLNRMGKMVFTDIDFVSYSKYRVKIIKFFEQRGFSINKRFLYHYGKKRHIYYRDNIALLEVFFDCLDMNHLISFKSRLEKDTPTIPLAELLLQKLQIVHINEKDIKDTIILLLANDIGNNDNKINLIPICNSLCKNWGFYFTATQNLNLIKSNLNKYKVLDNKDKKILFNKIDTILNYLYKQKKSFKWKTRSIFGKKFRWYKEVDQWDIINSSSKSEQ